MSKHATIAIFVIVIGFSCVYGLSRYLESARPAMPEGYADSDLDFPAYKLKGFALGAEGLVADWYWMRSLQYVGDKIVDTGLENLNLEDMRSLNPRLLYPLLDNATSLDPRLMAAYSYGATVLPAIDSQHAIQLTEKGIANNPGEWRLYQYLGYIHWRLGNYEKAAEVYESGSRVPGAPPFFGLMVGRMRMQSGSRNTAREVYRQMLTGASDRQTQTAAELRLAELDSLDEREVIDGELAHFQRQQGRCPASLSQIFTSLAKTRLPDGRDFRVSAKNELLDPTGAPYLLDESSCTVKLDSKLTKIPQR